MIVDIFSFAGELDLLELRLNILNEVVDEFIICEGQETTAGNPKPLFFKENMERYKKWWPKIGYHVFPPYTDPILNTFAANYLPIPQEQHWWHREFIQKESMRYALSHLKDDDIVMISDVDEIPSPEVIKYLYERYRTQG